MLRGYCGIGIFHPKIEHNIGTLWRSAHCMGASFIFTIGRRYSHQASDTTKAYKEIPLFNYRDMEELCENIPHGCKLVGVEQTKTSRPLNNYVHPNNAIYLLGAEDHGLSEQVCMQCHDLIEIPNIPICLNVTTAGSIVLYDRMAKAINRHAM